MEVEGRNNKGQFVKGVKKSGNWYKAMEKRTGSDHAMWKGGGEKIDAYLSSPVENKDSRPSREYKKIKLTQGKYAVVDAEAFDFLNQFSWYYHDGYARTSSGDKDMLMHRLLMKVSGEEIVDHANLNGLDNRKMNLRFATRSQNKANSPVGKANTSGYKGVYLKKGRISKKWGVSIGCNGKKIHIGYFDDKKEAATAYNQKAIELFGDYASLNNINL